MISPVQIAVSEAQILKAIELSKQQLFIDNLRNRAINVAFDSKVRGYVGEIALKEWFNQNGIDFSLTNHFDRKSSMDVDFLYQGNKQMYEIELKTSLVPDQDRTIEEAICQRDLKLIKRGNQPIAALKSDIHIQLMYNQRRAAKDLWLEQQAEITKKTTLEEIYDQLACYRYLTDAYLIGWIDKPTLIQQIEQKPTKRQTWKYGQREFWTCSLKSEIKPMQSLITFLKEA